MHGNDRPPDARFRLANGPLRLHVEAEFHYVAVPYHIVLAFDAKLAGLAGFGFGAQSQEVLKRDGLGGDESALEIAVDHPCRHRRPVAGMDRPCPCFLRTSREIRSESEKVIDRAN
jgi:hypothetical protein